jgi:hypothetical protein
MPWRRWHEHRAWSREARGLPPRESPPVTAPSGPAPPAGAAASQ